MFVPPAADAYPGTVGQPWGSERYAERLTALRAALVDPAPVELRWYERAGTGVVWMVAREADGTAVVYDPAASEFAPVDLRPDGAAWDVGVRGGLVTTYCAA